MISFRFIITNYNIYKVFMYKFLAINLLVFSLSSCSAFNWLWDKSEELGQKMPVKEGASRCEDGATCIRKRSPEQQQNNQQPATQNQGWVQPQTIENQEQNNLVSPQQPQQMQGYIPTSLPGEDKNQPNMYDEMSKKLPPDMQENPNKEAYEAYQKGLMQAGQNANQIQNQTPNQMQVMPSQNWQAGYPPAPNNIRMGY